MKLYLVGNIDGNILDLYDHAAKFNTKEDPITWILCTGSFGVWPDPARIDRGTRKNVGNSGDFAKLYINDWQAPLQTLLISGVHDDHKWLKMRHASYNMEILPNVHWLATGYRTSIGYDNESLRVTGFGKVYSENTFEGNVNKRSHRHYTRSEFEKACSSGPTDILMFHERPDNKIARKVIFATQPKLIIYSSKQPEAIKIMGVTSFGLSKEKGHVIDSKLLREKDQNKV